ncbi:MAG: hypothetical protein GX115_11015 [Ruminiclostridium sp.]|nr:hypothetical protein [Ruminiclostridium sp.]
MKKKKKKTTLDLMKTIRNEWSINPRTRVQENELRNKKKRRQDEKRMKYEW